MYTISATHPHNTARKVAANDDYEVAVKEAKKKKWPRPSVAFFERKYGLKPNQLKYFRANRFNRIRPYPEPEYCFSNAMLRAA